MTRVGCPLIQAKTNNTYHQVIIIISKFFSAVAPVLKLLLAPLSEEKVQMTHIF